MFGAQKLLVGVIHLPLLLGYPESPGITLNFAVHARRLFAREDRVTMVSALGDDAEANVVTAALDELLIEAYLTFLRFK